MGIDTLIKSIQKAWRARWPHYGRDGQMHLEVQPADMRFVTHFGEFNYQREIKGLIQQLCDIPGDSLYCV